MKKKKTKLSQSFQRWLIVLVAIAFLATTAFLWLIQTRLSENNAIDLLALNLSDVREDIIDASDANLLKLAWSVAADLNPMEDITGDMLQELTAKYADFDFGILDNYWPEVRNYFYPELQAVYSGQKTAQEAMDSFAAHVNEILANQ